MATYKIQSGDTLTKIANQYGLSVDTIASANGISNPNVIRAGASLNIPDAQTSQPAAAPSPAQGTSLQGVSQNTAGNVANYESGYKASDAVNNAQSYLQSILSNKPADFSSSYSDQLNGIYDQIMNRKDFSYDLNGDMLYQQYKDQYSNLGKNAMMDTMGQASALTGGYGSSYASTAGNQAYQSYLQQLNDKVPELYQLSKDSYNEEGEQLLNQYNVTGDMYDQEYGQYRDKATDYSNDRSYAQSAYDSERTFDYGDYSNMLSYWQDKAGQENGDYWNTTNFDYQKQRDSVADSQWAQEFALSQQKAASSGSSSTSEDVPEVSPTALNYSQKEAIVTSIKDAEGESASIAEITAWLNAGYISGAEAGALTRTVKPGRH